MTLDLLLAKLAARDAPRTEALVQADVRQLLLTAPLGLSEDVLLETQVGDRRRIDVEIGSTVIEIKKDLRVGNVLRDAVVQLCGYVAARENQFGRRYVGVITDGAEWRCYHLREAALVEAAKPLLVASTRPNVDEVLIWLEGVLATARDLKPTPEEVERRLGAGSSAHELDRASLVALFDHNRESPLVRTKRRLWARLLGTALGTQFEDSDELFVEHTLLVNIAEIIAHSALGLEPETLVPQSLLSGAKFDEAGVHGVVEADFFDWVADVPKGDVFIRTLARRIARFDWKAVEHDVLKVLYESMIGAETRKKLGEYYTPDWLAEKVVETAVPEPLGVRVLDPACGSGTFLFHAIRRYLRAAEGQGQAPAHVLDAVTHHVLGMDLHPVAVTLARVTYLLAIGPERLASPERGSIRVPVFLGDSVQWRQAGPTLWSTGALRIPVDDQHEITPSEFTFPSSLIKDVRKFDELVSDLADMAAQRAPGAKVPALSAVFQRHGVSDEARQSITATFHTMCRLHDEGRDHIWGYYIRNLARPEWLALPENRADVILGNPPWLAYRFMSRAMQAGFREMSESFGLWHGAKVATHQDLSALFVCRAMQLYLKTEGRFAFVMPSAVLDRGQYRGFRSGSYDSETHQLRARLGTPWDLRKVRPHYFPITASVMFGHRSESASSLPEGREVWKGKLPNGNVSWSRVEPLITRMRVQPTGGVDGTRSPYHGRFRQGASLVPRVFFMVDRQAAGPLGQVKNRVALRSARSANEKRPWKDLPGLDGVVESEFIYRVHLGETVLPYRTLNARSAVLPVERKGLLNPDGNMQLYRGLASWWSKATELWQQHRSTDRLSLMEQIDYHGKLRGQFPLSRNRIVYSKSGMHLAAARLSDHRAVIDHTLYWGGLNSDDEGHFLCAIMNTAVVTQRVRPLMSYGKDERHIDKFVWSLPIPTFDEQNPEHRDLAALGKAAEEAIGAIPLEGTNFVSQRRAVRAHLEESEIGRSIEAAVDRLLSRPLGPRSR